MESTPKKCGSGNISGSKLFMLSKCLDSLLENRIRTKSRDEKFIGSDPILLSNLLSFQLPLSNATYCYPSQSLGFDERLDPSLCEAHFCNSSIILDFDQNPIVAESLIRHPIANIDHRANCSLRIHDGNMTECKRKSFRGTISLFPRDSKLET